MNNNLEQSQQLYEFMTFFEFILQNPELLDKFMSLLNDENELIYFAAEYGFPLEKTSIKPGIARAIEILKPTMQ